MIGLNQQRLPKDLQLIYEGMVFNRKGQMPGGAASMLDLKSPFSSSTHMLYTHRILSSIVYLLVLITGSGDINAQTQIEIDNIEEPPIVTVEDQHLANIYKSLDGKWSGVFTIYKDPRPNPLGKEDLKNLTKEQATSSKFQRSYQIQVRQEYTSESPYFQKVVITDFNPSTGGTEVSHGVNKVQDGQMWCVVHKPSGTVIHKGGAIGEDTIIWQSSQKSPQKIEYFYESISDDTYEIIGYGYYEGDDIEKTPRLWFYGEYKRQEDE